MPAAQMVCYLRRLIRLAREAVWNTIINVILFDLWGFLSARLTFKLEKNVASYFRFFVCVTGTGLEFVGVQHENDHGSVKTSENCSVVILLLRARNLDL